MMSTSGKVLLLTDRFSPVLSLLAESRFSARPRTSQLPVSAGWANEWPTDMAAYARTMQRAVRVDFMVRVSLTSGV